MPLAGRPAPSRHRVVLPRGERGAPSIRWSRRPTSGRARLACRARAGHFRAGGRGAIRCWQRESERARGLRRTGVGHAPLTNKRKKRGKEKKRKCWRSSERASERASADEARRRWAGCAAQEELLLLLMTDLILSEVAASIWLAARRALCLSLALSRGALWSHVSRTARKRTNGRASDCITSPFFSRPLARFPSSVCALARTANRRAPTWQAAPSWAACQSEPQRDNLPASQPASVRVPKWRHSNASSWLSSFVVCLFVCLLLRRAPRAKTMTKRPLPYRWLTARSFVRSFFVAFQSGKGVSSITTRQTDGRAESRAGRGR